MTLGTSVGWSDIYPADYYEQFATKFPGEKESITALGNATSITIARTTPPAITPTIVRSPTTSACYRGRASAPFRVNIV